MCCCRNEVKLHFYSVLRPNSAKLDPKGPLYVKQNTVIKTTVFYTPKKTTETMSFNFSLAKVFSTTINYYAPAGYPELFVNYRKKISWYNWMEHVQTY